MAARLTDAGGLFLRHFFGKVSQTGGASFDILAVEHPVRRRFLTFLDTSIMSRIVKTILVLLATLVGIMAIAAVALFLFFDPNDFREEISAGVKDATGRDLVIEGDLSISLFPWLAIEVGRTELGNAEKFSDQPFLSFSEARLSVRILPLIFKQQATIGTASIDGLMVNLEVAANGSTNWEDLSAAKSNAGDPPVEGDGDPTEFNISNFVISNANVAYKDSQSGSSYVLSNLNLETGGIAEDEPVDIDAEFDVMTLPDNVEGHFAIRGTAMMSEGGAELTVEGLNVSGELSGIFEQPTEINFDSRKLSIDTIAERVTLGEMDLTALGIAMSANVAPFTYSATPQLKAELRVAEFSLKELMQLLDIEPPATADPDALSRVSFEANATFGENDIALTDMLLELDDSSLSGQLSLPLGDDGAIGFDLVVDSMNLDAYMAPADESASSNSASDDDIEIPVDMIRTLNAKGSFRIERASLSGMEFTNMQLGLNSGAGRLRLNPISADLYDGTYQGDVRIDASADIPVISVNERIAGVNLSSLAKSMFDQDNVSGKINGEIVLSGKGGSVAAIRQDLDGNMSFELMDGAFEGTDVWHQMRTARAKFRQEPAPEPKLPARTEFTTVSASGVVSDGIFENNDLLVELPFLQLTGNGIVDLNAAQINYSMQARVLEKPEFMTDVSAAELEDFTGAVIPLKVTGALSAPSIQPDIEAILRQQVEDVIEEKTEELKNRLFDRLLGVDDDETTDETTDEESAEEDPEKELQRKLLEKLIGD
jgi:AsmA protein